MTQQRNYTSTPRYHYQEITWATTPPHKILKQMDTGFHTMGIAVGSILILTQMSELEQKHRLVRLAFKMPMAIKSLSGDKPKGETGWALETRCGCFKCTPTKALQILHLAMAEVRVLPKICGLKAPEMLELERQHQALN